MSRSLTLQKTEIFTVAVEFVALWLHHSLKALFVALKIHIQFSFFFFFQTSHLFLQSFKNAVFFVLLYYPKLSSVNDEFTHPSWIKIKTFNVLQLSQPWRLCTIECNMYLFRLTLNPEFTATGYWQFPDLFVWRVQWFIFKYTSYLARLFISSCQIKETDQNKK